MLNENGRRKNQVMGREEELRNNKKSKRIMKRKWKKLNKPFEEFDKLCWTPKTSYYYGL